jgi:hypothetical protein
MRPLSELIDADDDAWPLVLRWVSESARPAEVVTCNPEAGEATLVAAQVSTRSPLGAVAFHSGGLLIDRGWLRFLGAASDRFGDGLIGWNAAMGGTPLDPPVGDAMLVGYDVLGGFFALNAGRWDSDPGQVHYFAPDVWRWEPMDLEYSGLLHWALSPQLDDFYRAQRWPGWQQEMAGVRPDHALSIYPPLGFEATPLSDRSRRPVPARELWSFLHDLGRQLSGIEPGQHVKFEVKD